MPSFKEIASVWNNLREIDLRPLREAALREVRIALVGRPGVGRHTLAAQMRRDPARPGVFTQSPLAILDLQSAPRAEGADLIILLLDAAQSDIAAEQTLAARWMDEGKKLLVFCNKYDRLQQGQILPQWVGWQAGRILYGSAADADYLHREFVPAVLELLPEHHLSLGRHFPLFRLPIAHQLIGETCLSNTAYALSTGLAEIVPALDLPLNLTDMIVLTKSQAFLAYKLGLLLGFSTRWQDYVAEFGGVIGSGFLWRQLARSLVGLIPVWGILPKVAVAYAGTYVVGNAILQWYLTGRHLSPQQLRLLYAQALQKGRQAARRALSRVKRSRPPSLPPPSPLPALPSEAQPPSPADQPQPTQVAPQPAAKPPPKEKKPLFARRKKAAAQPPSPKTCPQCTGLNAPDARFCQYCAHPFDSLPETL